MPYASPEKRLENDRKRRAKNGPALLEKRRQLYAATREVSKVASLKWYRENRERALALKRASYTLEGGRLHLLKKYGLTVALFEAMLAIQNGACAVCKTTDPGGKGQWHVDHVHVQQYASLPAAERLKLVRGLLCHGCNTGINLADSVTLLRAKADYLEAFDSAILRSTLTLEPLALVIQPQAAQASN